MNSDTFILALLVLLALLLIVVLIRSFRRPDDASKVLELQRRQLEEVNRRQIELLNQQHSQQLQSLATKYDQQIQTMRHDMATQFKALSSEVLQQNSRSLRESNSEQIEAILRPFKENIDSFRKAVNDSYVNENASRKSLYDQIEKLMRLNESIGKEAHNLTTALKGNSKVQGDWGEMILETLLENAGLQRGVNYDVQATRDSSGELIRSEEGGSLRPDVIIYLPDNQSIVVDSKVSLSAFVDYCNAETELEQKDAGKRHLQSVVNHINELDRKRYQRAVKGSADYVMMFIPNESAYVTATQLDINIWKYAYDRGVMLVSPTHLFSVMSIVTQLWQQDKQNKHALRIAEKGGKLYDKLVLFVESFESVGKSIGNAQEAFDKSRGQLMTGKGNALKQANDLRELGAKTTKQLPDRLLSDTDLPLT